MIFSCKITTLLVDDDQLVLDDLSRLIPWEDLGFTIVNKAHNGKQALALFKDLRPKLIITDIIMPLMDGINLIREIKKIEPETIFLVLSSYNDFNYAKSALQLGVTDYLLKTEINPSSLEAKMLKISTDIQQNYNTRRKYQSLELQEYFHMQTYDSNIPGSFLDRNQNLNYYFFLCSASSLLRHKFLENSTDLFLKSFTEQLSIAIGLSDYDFAFSLNNYILIGVKCNSISSSETIRMWIDNINSFFLSLEFNSTLFFMNKSTTIVSFKKLYLSIKSKLDYILFFTQEQAINLKTISTAVPDEKLLQIPDHTIFTNLMLKENGLDQLIEWLDQIEASCDLSKFRELFINACNLFRKAPAHEIFKIVTFQSLKVWAKNEYTAWRSPTYNNMDNHSSHVKNAILYILNNYMNSSISIDDIANSVGISNNRLSVLFKQEVNKTINEYLTSCRIEAAISLLLNSNYKIYEIADRVGYNSSQYFSQTFFSHTGKKPLDYRKNTLTTITMGDNI
jgi:two-component system, response regulator YesN